MNKMANTDNLNYTYSPGVAPGMVEYYEKKLITNAKPDMVYGRDGQKRSIPKNSGKIVQFRQLVPYEASTVPLKEGITPDGQEIRQRATYALLRSYGRHIELTDELNMYHLDSNHKELSDLLSDQALLSLDTICRDALMAGLNVQYANGKTSRAQITSADKLTTDEVKKAVRTLRRNNAKPFEDGYYHAVVHPDTVYDLTNDELWIDVAKYQDKERIEKGEIGILLGVKFFTTTNAAVFKPEEYLYDSVASIAITNLDLDWKKATLTNHLSSDDQNKLVNKLVQVNGTITCIERFTDSDEVFFKWLDQGAAGGTAIEPVGAGSGEAYGTIIYGKDAYGNISLEGENQNVHVIINPPGSAGANDPLAQRGTIAWKVAGFACKILQDAYIVRVEHGATV